MTDRGGRITWVARAVALAPLVGLGLDDSSETQRWNDVPAVSETCEPGSHEIPLRVDGRWWTYTAQVPASPDDPGVSPSALPVVIFLHGSGQSGAEELERTGWTALAEREGFLAIAPNGLPAEPDEPADFWRNPRLWNSGQHPSDRPRSQIDDLAFFDALLDDIARRWPVDQSRIYVTGHSNGGAMAFRLAAERADRIAAIAPVSGLCWLPDPKPARLVPTLMIVGTRDPLMPIDGGRVILPWEIRYTPPVLPAADRWAQALGLPESPIRFETIDERVYRDYAWNHADADPPFRAIAIERHGHDWPGARRTPFGGIILGPRIADVDGTALVWDFLRRHRREPS